MDRSSGCGRNSERANTVHKKCTLCGDSNRSEEKKFKRIRKEKEKSCADGDSDNRRTERTPLKCFRYGFEDHLIAKFPNPPKAKYVLMKKVIVHATTAKVTVTKIYIHPWHVYLVMMNFLVKI